MHKVRTYHGVGGKSVRQTDSGELSEEQDSADNEQVSPLPDKRSTRVA